MLRPVLLLLVLLLPLLAAPAAWAVEEVFVLDNGTTFRGQVIRSGDSDIQIRLAGFGRNASVTLATARIVTRFVPVDTTARTTKTALPDADWTADAQAAAAAPIETDTPVVLEQALPAEEPSTRDEGFFHRLARVAVLSMPASIAGRTVLGVLLFVALLALVMLGCRLAEIEELGLGRAAVLAALMGAFLVADIWLHEVVLRADRATWVLPVQAALWLTLAVPVLRCGFARTILLFAFVMFSLAVLMFTAGAILVTY